MIRAKHTFLFLAALLLAACGQQTEPLESAEEIIGSSNDLAVQMVGDPYEWDFSGEVVINGLGLGNVGDSFLDGVGSTTQDTLSGLPAGSQLYAQGILKGFGGPADPGEVTLSTPTDDYTTSTSFTTDPHGAGAFYDHVFTGGNLSQLSIAVENQSIGGQFIPRGLASYSFVPGTDTHSIGIAPYRYIFGEVAPGDAYESWSETLALGSAWDGGDIDVTFVIGDMQDDARGVVLTIEALDSSDVSTEIYRESPTQPDDGTAGTEDDELLVQRAVVSPPSGTVAIRATVWSPPYGTSGEVNGDSVYWTGLNLTYGVTPPPAEGCTPGYWRQTHHYDSWTGHEPTDSFEDVFDRDVTLTGRPLGTQGGRPVSLSEPVLGEAVAAIGGGVNAVARHAVAGLLNAASPDVDYRWTEAQVIEVFQQAFDGVTSFGEALELLVPANEAGCPLN